MIFGFLGSMLAQTPAQQSQPSYVLRGTLTQADRHTYKLLPFSVPAGTRRLTVVFSHNSAAQRTVVDLGLFDPQRFRGWSGSDKRQLTLSDYDATPSYTPGPLVPGTWQLLLGIPNIRDGVRTEYTAEIYLSSSVESAPRKPLRDAPGWFQGDLHAHTGHSDGSCMSTAKKKVPCPEYKVIERAAELGLDFLAITDHNTVSHYNNMTQWQDYFDQLLLVRGREITTFFGHANIYGTSDFVDFRVTPQFTATDVAKAAHRAAALISINHPVRPSGEECMGCGWQQPTVDYAQVDAIEAVNGPDPGTQYSGIPFWEAQLNAGHRITAIGGSDDHKLAGAPAYEGHLGTPTTVVYARELSEPALLEGIKAGHVFVKIKGPNGPNVFFEARSGEQRVMTGENLHTRDGDLIDLSVHFQGADDARVEIIRDGRPEPLRLFSSGTVGATSPDAARPKTYMRDYQITSDGTRHWYRVDIRAADGSLLALTNPIYENFPEN